MTYIKQTVLAGLFAITSFGAAHAGTISGTFNMNIYQGSGANFGSAPTDQAVKTNPLITQSDKLASIKYTGPIAFSEGANGTNLISAFLTSAGGSYTTTSGSLTGAILSTAGYGTTTVFDIFSTGASFGAAGGTGTISHDDGATLYQDGRAIMNSAAPTESIMSAYTLVSGHPIEIVYVEANNLPADLNMIPEPASMALLSAGLIGTAILVRRRRKAA